MEKRTILNAVMNRVPEVFFIQGPQYKGDKCYWCLWANIKGRPYKLLADMPKTSLISHKELISTFVSEVYDEVGKIKRVEIAPDLPENERGLPQFSDEDRRLLGIGVMEDAIADNAMGFLDATTMPSVRVTEDMVDKDDSIASK